MADETPATDAPAPADDATTPVTPAPAPEAKEPEGEPPAAVEPSAPEPDAPEPEAPAEAGPPKEGEEPAPEQKPADLNEQARRGYEQRQQSKAALTQALKREYQAPTPTQLQEQEGLDETQSQIAALERRVELNETINQVADLNASIEMDAQAVESNFDGVFNADSPNYDKEWAEKVAADYIRDGDVKFAQHVDNAGKPVVNPDGTPSLYVVSARVSLYDYHKSRYEDRARGAKQGQVSGQRAAERMLASTDRPLSQSPQPAKKDHLRELWGLD